MNVVIIACVALMGLQTELHATNTILLQGTNADLGIIDFEFNRPFPACYRGKVRLIKQDHSNEEPEVILEYGNFDEWWGVGKLTERAELVLTTTSNLGNHINNFYSIRIELYLYDFLIDEIYVMLE